MRRVAIFSDNSVLLKLWSHALVSHFDIFTASTTADLINADLVVIDSQKVDDDANPSALFSSTKARFLITGKEWSESKQINVKTKRSKC